MITFTITDELFQNAGKEGEAHFDPLDPPRCRANKRRGRGAYDNDRPPVVGTVGRETGQVRLRVVRYTTGEILVAHLHQFAQLGSQVFIDEYQSYNHVIRPHATVCHGANEWARLENLLPDKPGKSLQLQLEDGRYHCQIQYRGEPQTFTAPTAGDAYGQAILFIMQRDNGNE